MEPLIFERGDHLYIVGPVAPITPGDEERAEFAFADALIKYAPNDAIMWLRGQYVEADRPNRNGQMWSSTEVALKSLTPRLMPVTVMHDPATAVGLIADTRLLVPDTDKVPLARIDTALAVWAHRFPEIAEECLHNYKQGSLMQSMECSISHYECTQCGRGFVKLPGGAERANWCDHLNAGAANGVPVRRLEGVTFTGTGLIFGTRSGATGALDKAHLEVFQSEVAEFHERAVSDRRTPRRTSGMDDITIKRSEYDQLKADAAKAVELAQEVATLKPLAEKVTKLESDAEANAIALKAAQDDATAEKAKREGLEESARSATLAGERLSKLGVAFTGKLPESVLTRLNEQAATLKDEDWTARLEELSALTGVKPDEGGNAPAVGAATTGETASTQFGNASTSAVPSRAAVSTVLGGLMRQVRPAAPTPAKPAGK